MSSNSAAQRPVPRAGVLAIDAYVPGQEHGARRRENLQAVVERDAARSLAARQGGGTHAIADHLEDYPDGGATALREAIAARYGLDPARIVCGSGSDELISLLTHAYVGPGDEGLFTEHGFLVYRIAINSAGGTPVVAPETDFTADVDAILAAVTARTKIVFLANPNNPTGTFVPFAEVKRLVAGLPPHVLLVLDAAYAEYVTRNDYAAGLELAATHDNVVMTRTFSKIHGLANLRLGWLYAPTHVCDALNRTRGPFNTNGAAIAAGVASIGDLEHEAKSVAHNARLAGMAQHGDFRARHQGDAERRKFPADAFRRCGDGAARRRLSQRARASSCAPSAPMACLPASGSPSARRRRTASSCKASPRS